MRYLLDTNVVSELRKTRCDPGVHRWVAARNTSDLAISVVTLIEIETGIRRIARSDHRQADRLARWFEDSLLTGFADRIVSLDVAVARRVAPLHVPDRAPQHDAIIAGTALARSLVVVSRNARYFERSGVEFINPWSTV